MTTEVQEIRMLPNVVYSPPLGGWTRLEPGGRTFRHDLSGAMIYLEISEIDAVHPSAISEAFAIAINRHLARRRE